MVLGLSVMFMTTPIYAQRAERSFEDAVTRVIGIVCLDHAYERMPISEFANSQDLRLLEELNGSELWESDFGGGKIELISHGGQLPACTAKIFGPAPEDALEAVESVIAGNEMPDAMTFDAKETLYADGNIPTYTYHQRGRPYLDALITPQPLPFNREKPSLVLTFSWSERSLEAIRKRLAEEE